MLVLMHHLQLHQKVLVFASPPLSSCLYLINRLTGSCRVWRETRLQVQTVLTTESWRLLQISFVGFCCVSLIQSWRLQTCIHVPVLQKPHPFDLNNNQTVALSSHIINILERIITVKFTEQNRWSQDQLLFTSSRLSGSLSSSDTFSNFEVAATFLSFQFLFMFGQMLPLPNLTFSKLPSASSAARFNRSIYASIITGNALFLVLVLLKNMK